MEVRIKTERPAPELDDRKIREKVKKVLGDLGCRDRELSILFTDDGEMARLNRQYRDKPEPTNVLSFPMMGDGDAKGPSAGNTNLNEGFPETPLLGDVVISVETALREANEAEEPFEKTIDRLLIHGILHLLGYDHEKSRVDWVLMTKEEERLLGFFWM